MNPASAGTPSTVGLSSLIATLPSVGANPDVSWPGAHRWGQRLGGLRDVVRQEVVARQLSELLDDLPPRPLHVLDAGCGQGTQALRLAHAGHTVTGLDPSAELLDRFAAELSRQPRAVRGRVQLIRGRGEAALELTHGPFDLILCHGVLMYLDDLAPILVALTAVASADGWLSLLVRNGLAPAMRDGLRGEWAGACAAFDSPRYVNRLGLAARAHTPAELDAALATLGWRRERWLGVRVFSDHRDGTAPPGDELEQLLSAEYEAGRRDPYRSVAALLHLTYARSL
jgi:S-adenosylmethionine-dependent methyltransferase